MDTVCSDYMVTGVLSVFCVVCWKHAGLRVNESFRLRYTNYDHKVCGTSLWII